MILIIKFYFFDDSGKKNNVKEGNTVTNPIIRKPNHHAPIHVGS